MTREEMMAFLQERGWDPVAFSVMDDVDLAFEADRYKTKETR